MAILDLFSKRQKRLRGEIPEVYTYDNLPNHFRVQVVHIIQDSYGNDNHSGHVKNAYKIIHDALCREYGKFNLLDNRHRESDEQAVLNFFLTTLDTEQALDVIELTFRLLNNFIKNNNEYNFFATPKLKPDEAIEELNNRFKEHGIGFQFIESEIIRVDSIYTHSEIAKPTISLLWNKKFQGANEEYLKAHEHYRHGRNKECLTECLKAFESTMKIICSEKGWGYSQTDTAKKLIQICFINGLVPTYVQNQFTSLQNLLESGIPTIRNKLSGHGQGQIPQRVDDGMTRYGLNLTGTNIIFLVEQSGIL